MYQIDFAYRMPGEEISRRHGVKIKMNGTKPTGMLVTHIIKNFILFFEEHAPMGSLEHAVCVVESTDEKVFEMKFGTDGA